MRPDQPFQDTGHARLAGTVAAELTRRGLDVRAVQDPYTQDYLPYVYLREYNCWLHILPGPGIAPV